MKTYPDVSELLALKQARRQTLAELPVAAKMEITKRLAELSKSAPEIISSKLPSAGSTVKHTEKRE